MFEKCSILCLKSKYPREYHLYLEGNFFGSDLALKQRFVVFTFILVLGIASFYGIIIDWEKRMDLGSIGAGKKIGQENVSAFRNFRYYSLRNSKENIQISGLNLEMNLTSNDMFFTSPVGISYIDERTPLHFRGMKGIYNSADVRLQLNESVLVNTNDSELKADQVVYFVNDGKAFAEGSVKSKSYVEKTKDNIFIDSDQAKSNFKRKESSYEGRVNGFIDRKLPYESDIKFSSDNLNYFGFEERMALTGNVYIEREKFKAWAKNGEVFFENYNKKLRYYTLSEDVKLHDQVLSKENKVIQRKAFAEKLEGIISEDKIVLTGYPKVIQDKDLIKGTRIVLRNNNEIIEVDEASSFFYVE